MGGWAGGGGGEAVGWKHGGNLQGLLFQPNVLPSNSSSWQFKFGKFSVISIISIMNTGHVLASQNPRLLCNRLLKLSRNINSHKACLILVFVFHFRLNSQHKSHTIHLNDFFLLF